MEKELNVLGKSYTIKDISIRDEGALQQLCEKCIDYFQVVEGKSPEADAAASIIKDLPPNKKEEDKFMLGCFDEGDHLIAMIETVKNYPVDGQWIIGLLLIHPLARRNGLGRSLHDLVKDYALENTVTELRVGVVEDNETAVKFWSSLDYKAVKKVDMTMGKKENVVIVMTKLIS